MPYWVAWTRKNNFSKRGFLADSFSAEDGASMVEFRKSQNPGDHRDEYYWLVELPPNLKEVRVKEKNQ